jgi:hypothetical protein
VPANVTAIVMKSNPGEELTCRALNYNFEQNGERVPRGIISYYATATLVRATTFESWLDAMNAAIESDLLQRRLNRLNRPSLQITGDGSAHAPGRPGG